MSFGLNYSPQAAALVRSGAITIDRFKCPPWEGLIAEAREVAPIYVHFDLAAGSGELTDMDWGEVETLLHTTDTPYVNLHLAPRRKHFYNLREPLNNDDRARVIDRMIADVAAAVHEFGADKVMVENIPWRGAEDKYVGVCVEPEVFRLVLETTSAQMLFDISHARIAALSLGMDQRAYINALPLERMQELHITGLHRINGELVDHMDFLPDDWVYFDWVMEKIAAHDIPAPWIVSFEYGGVTDKFDWRSKPDVIAAQVPRMVETVRAALNGSMKHT